MNQSELIIKTAQISGLSRKDVEHALKTAGDVVSSALADEGEAVLPGLGKLVVNLRQAHTGRNPRTGEAIAVPAHKVVKFRPASALKGGIAF